MSSSMSFGISIDDHTDDILRALSEKIPIAMAAIGEEAEGYAKGNCPVDTGRLRNSINWAVENAHGSGDGRDNPLGTPSKGTVYVGTNVEYAEYIEYGDMSHKVGQKHFLRDSMLNHVEHYKAILEAALKS